MANFKRTIISKRIFFIIIKLIGFLPLFIFSPMGKACGPQDQNWTWGGVNQYRPEECTCAELDAILKEEEVIYLGNMDRGFYLFSNRLDCRLKSKNANRQSEVKDRHGSSCQVGFTCLAKDQRSKFSLQ